MNISPITSNENYPIYNENTTQSNKIQQNQRPVEEIEAELEAAKAEMEKNKKDLGAAEKEYEEKAQQFHERWKEREDLKDKLIKEGKDPLRDPDYRRLTKEIDDIGNSLDGSKRKLEDLEEKVFSLNRKIRSLERELFVKLDGNSDDLLPKPMLDPILNTDAPKPTGLFDLLRKEPEQLS